MHECFFCGLTERPLTEEHVWPIWVSKLLRRKYGSDHFVHIRSTGNDTSGLWKAPVLKVTTKSVCDKCNNDWLSGFENDVIKPIASPLILGEPIDIIKPADQERLAAWAYKMALLLEVAMPQSSWLNIRRCCPGGRFGQQRRRAGIRNGLLWRQLRPDQ